MRRVPLLLCLLLVGFPSSLVYASDAVTLQQMALIVIRLAVSEINVIDAVVSFITAITTNFLLYRSPIP